MPENPVVPNPAQQTQKLEDTYHRYLRVLRTTKINYEHKISRLAAQQRFYSRALVIYSIFLIILTITNKFYDTLFDCTFVNYVNLVLSIVILVLSLLITNERIPERICSIDYFLTALNEITGNIKIDTMDESMRDYNKIISNVENRDDVDFFRTTLLQCKANNIRIWGRFITIERIAKEKLAEKDGAETYDAIKDSNKRAALEDVLRHLAQCKRLYCVIKVVSSFTIKLVVMLTPVGMLVLYFILKSKGILPVP